MAFISIPIPDVSFKAPLDETLMLLIKDNLDDLDARVGAAGGGGGLSFKINGALRVLRTRIEKDISRGRMLDGAAISSLQTFTKARLFLKKNGISGKTKIDIKRHRRVDHPIESVSNQLDRTVQSVGRVGASLNTQVITKRTPQINTQVISRVHPDEVGSSVIPTDATKARYNTSSLLALDNDWKVGAKVLVQAMGNAANDGEFTILEINPDGYPALVLDNAAAVAETAGAGTLSLQMFEYIFINPIDAVGFKVGENVIFAGHTAAFSDGAFEIVRINDAANNIIIYNNTVGADVQALPAGNANAERYVYTFAAPVTITDYFTGEALFANGHTSANNDGNLPIVEINETGNNVVVINSLGLVQAGVAGTIDTNRWTYALDADPTPDIAVSNLLKFSNLTAPANDGTFELKELNRFALNNVTVFNEGGVVQGAPAGGVVSELVLINFGTDFAAFYIAGRSIATTLGFVNIVNNGYFEVVEINRGGGAAKNIVIKNIDAIEEIDPIGQIDIESRSLFDSDLPEIEAGEDVISSGATAVFNPAAVEAESVVAIEVLELPEGNPEDLTVELA